MPKINPRPEIQNTLLDQHGALDFKELENLGISPDEIIDFSVNSNPFGPSPAVEEALQRVVIDRYPDRESLSLRKALAMKFDLKLEEIIVGNGTAELLWLVAMAFIRPNDRALVLSPTFGEYARSVSLMGAQIETLWAREEKNFVFSEKIIHDALEKISPRLAFICNPNNPTGITHSPETIASLAKSHPKTLFVIDEAYIQFVPKMPSSISLGLPNLLILRSMTKDYAIAGIRLGYAVGPSDIIASLKKVRPPWSVNAAAQEIGLASLMDTEYLPRTLSLLRKSKEQFLAGFHNLGLNPLPSETHYFIAKVGNAAKFRSQLLKYKLQVRDCASFGLPDHIRVATKKPEENEILLSRLKEIY
ncbi:MAG: histidinol-phosphate aminotransferase family protein [Chloroflexi bacterium]|nr:histidinol-phosphate aminotransferase family protein [Chloroflexota bacterium]